MRSNEERIRQLHQRADRFQKEIDKKKLIVSGSTSAFLLTLLVCVALFADRQSARTIGNTFVASSLLSTSVGGYVLTAVAAFMIGVIMTVILKKRSEKNEKED